MFAKASFISCSEPPHFTYDDLYVQTFEEQHFHQYSNVICRWSSGSPTGNFLEPVDRLHDTMQEFSQNNETFAVIDGAAARNLSYYLCVHRLETHN